jgi:hypothetical protein
LRAAPASVSGPSTAGSPPRRIWSGRRGDQSIAEDLIPVIESARLDKDPLRGLSRLIEAAISLGAREHSLLAAARRAGSLTSDISVSLNAAFGELAREGQRVGSIRADLVTDDLPRLVSMLFSVLSTMDSDSDGWRRYVALVVDAISVDERQPLPPAAALRFTLQPDSWPL